MDPGIWHENSYEYSLYIPLKGPQGTPWALGAEAPVEDTPLDVAARASFQAWIHSRAILALTLRCTQ